MMAQYEYKVDSPCIDALPGDFKKRRPLLEAWLNEKGLERWQLVSKESGIYIFTRRLIP
jgi:hypothetical protein